MLRGLENCFSIQLYSFQIFSPHEAHLILWLFYFIFFLIYPSIQHPHPPRFSLFLLRALFMFFFFSFFPFQFFFFSFHSNENHLNIIVIFFSSFQQNLFSYCYSFSNHQQHSRPFYFIFIFYFILLLLLLLIPPDHKKPLILHSSRSRTQFTLYTKWMDFFFFPFLFFSIFTMNDRRITADVLAVVVKEFMGSYLLFFHFSYLYVGRMCDIWIYIFIWAFCWWLLVCVSENVLWVYK